ncbi:PTS system mannose/fructose/N-acetylgalactosamine-transporter subunit IIB [Enterococcus faecium]|uniref:PTS EIIB type-4 domain-containing protein n=1 Tax=Enterococcus faecium TaxID=1352 RepID=A0A242BCD0_ENTFC|nr:PTS sugar transporter subunit IIB [Enterococcus faecium]OTN93137.1 hypothetical protein A5810_002596 [Enterococcus faecium]
MTITLARIDDRVIHGQTMTRWTKQYAVQGILVVSDEVAKDELRKKVLKAAAAELKLGIYTVEQAKESIPKAVKSNKNFFLITDSPAYFAQLAEAGIDFGKVVNVGPISGGTGAINVARNVALTQNEYDAFEKLETRGYRVTFQLLPDDEKKSWEVVKKKYS